MRGMIGVSTVMAQVSASAGAPRSYMSGPVAFVTPQSMVFEPSRVNAFAVTFQFTSLDSTAAPLRVADWTQVSDTVVPHHDAALSAVRAEAGEPPSGTRATAHTARAVDRTS